MAKTAKHDVFDMSDDIARIKKRKSSAAEPKDSDTGDISYTTGKGSKRRVTRDDDKLFNIRVSADLHKRFRMEAIDRGESMNLMIVRAMIEYADKEGF